MKIARVTNIAIHRFLAESFRYKTPAEGARTTLPFHHLAGEHMILPPYLGEFGMEIRFFLGAVEPWLRNGWKIPARRPELYPSGSAFRDTEFFGHIDRLKQRTGGTEILLNLYIESSSQPWRGCTFVPGANPAVVIEAPDEAFYGRIAAIEREIRSYVKSRYFHPRRLETVWDYPLTAVHVPWAPSVAFPFSSLVPTYMPHAFGVDIATVTPHVGVQLRNVGKMPERNSDIDRLMPLLQGAANHLGLPLLCYGHPEGTRTIPGIPSTFELAGTMPLLEFELGSLAKCKLLFAPESGIANLAGWLQVPTLLESQRLGYEYESLRPFNPRIDILDFAVSIESQIERLLSAKVRLPDPENALEPKSFHHPAWGFPALFRDEFDL